MASNGKIGSVLELWRFPVKSMGGERLEEADLERHGIVGDRGYALIELETGKVVTAKSVRKFPGLLEFAASYLEPPRAGQALPAVRITFPDRTSVVSDSGDADQMLSAHFKVDVRLARGAPENYTIDQYHPDIEDVDPRGNRDTFVEQKLGAALFAERGIDSPVPVGSFFDLYPMTVITTSTFDRLRELAPKSRFDARRFRMNAILATEGSGFIENEWIGRDLSVGGSVRLKVTLPDPRCVMTTLPQGDLPKDSDVLRTLVEHNRAEFGDFGRFPCAGVFAAVGAPGTMRVGDPVTIG